MTRVISVAASQVQRSDEGQIRRPLPVAVDRYVVDIDRLANRALCKSRIGARNPSTYIKRHGESKPRREPMPEAQRDPKNTQCV